MVNQRPGRAAANKNAALPRRSNRIAGRHPAIPQSMVPPRSHAAGISSASPARQSNPVAGRRAVTPESTATPIPTPSTTQPPARVVAPTPSTARRSARIAARHQPAPETRAPARHSIRATSRQMATPESMPPVPFRASAARKISTARRSSRRIAGEQPEETGVVLDEIVIATPASVPARAAPLRSSRAAHRNPAVPQTAAVPSSSQKPLSSTGRLGTTAAAVAPNSSRLGVSNWRPNNGVPGNRGDRVCRFCSSDPIGMVVNSWNRCDWTDGRFPLECTNCADYRTTNPNAPLDHDCDVPLIHQMFRKYAAADPVRYDRAFNRQDGTEIEQHMACTECTSIGRHTGCDIDPRLALECTRCSKRKVGCRLLSGPLMRPRPNLRQGVTRWFRHACDCCDVLSKDRHMPLQSRCTWLENRSTWDTRCNRCVAKGLACLTQGMLGTIPREIFIPRDWKVRSFLELGWAELRPGTIWRKSCRHCNRDGAHCRAAMARPYSACGRCTAIGLDCVSEDGTLYPIFDLSQVGFGLFLPFPACGRCIETGRNCDRQRPCDSCTNTGECGQCDKIDIGSSRRAKNCIYGRLDPAPGPLYYLASGYGANGVDNPKDGSKLEHWVGPFTSTYAMQGVRFRDRAVVSRVLGTRRVRLPAGRPPHATPGSVLATMHGSRLTGDNIADMIKEMWPEARLLNTTFNFHNAQVEFGQMRLELVQDPTPGDLAPASEKQLNDVAVRLQRDNALGPMRITNIVDALAVVEPPNQVALLSMPGSGVNRTSQGLPDNDNDPQADDDFEDDDAPQYGDNPEGYGHTQEYPDIDSNTDGNIDTAVQPWMPVTLFGYDHGGARHHDDAHGHYDAESHGDFQGYPNTNHNIDPVLLSGMFAGPLAGYSMETTNYHGSSGVSDDIYDNDLLAPSQRQLVADEERLSPGKDAMDPTQQGYNPAGSVMSATQAVLYSAGLNPQQPVLSQQQQHQGLWAHQQQHEQPPAWTQQQQQVQDPTTGFGSVNLGAGPFQTVELQAEHNLIWPLQLQQQRNISYAALGRWRHFNPTHEANLRLVHWPSDSSPETLDRTPFTFGGLSRGNPMNNILGSVPEPTNDIVDKPTLLQALMSADPHIPKCFEPYRMVNGQNGAEQDIQCGAPVLYTDVCASMHHTTGPFRFVCDACDRQSASLLVEPGFNPLTAAEVVGMRCYLCDICAITRGRSTELMMDASWLGVNTVHGVALGQASDGNMAHLKGIPPIRGAVTFFDQARPLTGCSCGIKLFKTRQCRVHRIENGEAMVQHVAAVKEWRIRMHQDKACPSCMGIDAGPDAAMEGTSDSEKVKAWVCLACGGWVMNQTDMPLLVDGWQAWFVTPPESLRVIEEEDNGQDVEMVHA